MSKKTSIQKRTTGSLHPAGSAAGVQKKKIGWLVEQGGKLIDDDADESIVKYRSAYAVIDKWGRVVWMTKPPNAKLTDGSAITKDV
jgi:hypothetical protein